MFTLNNQDFYCLITPPNVEEILEKFKTIKHSKNQFFGWKTNCNVKTTNLNKDEVATLMAASVKIFLDELNKKCDVGVTECWRNDYERGHFQELHDHFTENVDFSSVLFLSNHSKNFGHFYFYNRNHLGISNNWKKILYPNGDNTPIFPNIGDILFFPSHILHGVTPHNSDRIRSTISVNYHFIN